MPIDPRFRRIQRCLTLIAEMNSADRAYLVDRIDELPLPDAIGAEYAPGDHEDKA